MNIIDIEEIGWKTSEYEDSWAVELKPLLCWPKGDLFKDDLHS